MVINDAGVGLAQRLLWLVERRATWGRNRRRSFGSADRFNWSASIARSHISLSIEAFTAVVEASTAGLASHSNRVHPSPASAFSSRSKSQRTCSVNKWATLCEVNSPAAARAVPTIFANAIAPGRITSGSTIPLRVRR
ncbi:hypothetical protein Aros01_06161 [Streptosporangium roseum]|uniref:Uncharacterized protein n=1 Tax=Streptosporangium roseum (strain ATCC 12428 / DSM 43021 / JCM 3005 / KCTC 9067 / NCIMB 10171 / NRRL 2505 / NI 9100) TaxID=479432 RepID=D2AWA2_STRRD|nr:hypothetical protein Sros_2070 [Streptosporangium roseum DSM 43021]